MDAPSMVQRAGDKFIVRSVVSGDQLFVDHSKRNKAGTKDDNAMTSNNNNNNDSDEDTVNDLVINEDVLAEQDIDEEEEEDDQEPQDDEEQNQQGSHQDDAFRQQLVKENLLQFMNQNMDTESLRWLLFNNNNSAMQNKNIIGGGAAGNSDDGTLREAMSGDSGNSSHLPQCKIKRNYSCSNCTFFTQNPRQYLMHLRDIHGEKLIIHECKHCIYASRHYQKLVRHMKMVHGLSVDQDGSHLAIRKRGGPSLQQQQQLQSQLLLSHLVAATSAKRAKSSSAGSSVGADEINNNSLDMSSTGGGGGGGEGSKGGPSSICISSRSSRSQLINPLCDDREDNMDEEDRVAKKPYMENNNIEDKQALPEEDEQWQVAVGGSDRIIKEESQASQKEDFNPWVERKTEKDRNNNERDTLNNQFYNNIDNKNLINSKGLFCKPIEALRPCASNTTNNNRNETHFVSLLELLNSKSSADNNPCSPAASLHYVAATNTKANRLAQKELLSFDNDDNTPTDDDHASVNFMRMMLLHNKNNPNNNNRSKRFKNNHHAQLPARNTTPLTKQTTTTTTQATATTSTAPDFSETININATINNATADDNNPHQHTCHTSSDKNHTTTPEGGGINNRLSKCTVCEFEAPSRELLAAHEAAVHAKTKFFRCPKCNYVTHIRTRFSKHVKYHSMPMIKCNMCDFRTPYKWNLDRHMKNHGGSGPFKCAACNFTADIKQSLTVHEMNHHDPPVGSAVSGGGVLSQHQASQQQQQSQKRRNRVGASDANIDQVIQQPETDDFASGLSFHFLEGTSMLSDHLKSIDLVAAAAAVANMKKSARPIPNLIPLQGQPTTGPSTSVSALNLSSKSLDSRSQHTDSNSDTSANEMNAMDQDDNSNPASVSSAFKKKHGSFFDKLKEKIGTNGEATNLTCPCSHVAKCLSELFIHQKSCQKFKQHQMSSKTYSPNLINNKNSSRCQYCRHRCKSSADLVAHMQNCVNAQLFLSNALNVNIEQDSASELDHEEKMDEEGDGDDEHQQHQQSMENRIFVWNKMPEAADHDAGSATGSEGNNPDLSMFTPQIKQEKIDDLDLSLEMHSTFRRSPESPRSHKHHQPQQMMRKDANSACLKKVFKCPHCSFWASTASRFHVHIVGHLNKKPFECSLCAYRSNWRWDITKHIRLKTIRDPGHKTAKVLMNDETGRRNYTKYNKYITLMKVTEGDGNLKLMKSGEMTPNQEASLQSPHENISGSGAGGGSSGTSPLAKANSNLTTMQKLLLNDATSSNLLKLSQGGFSTDNMLASGSDLSALLMASQQQAGNNAFGEGSGSEKKPTTFKCKKCNYRDPNKTKVQEHVKRHYRDEEQQEAGKQKGATDNNNPAVEITPIYNTTNNNIVAGLSAADTNLLLANTKTLSNFFASQSLLPIIQAAAAATNNNNSNSLQPNVNGIVMNSGGVTVDGNGVVGGGNNNNIQLQMPSLKLQPPPSVVASSSLAQTQPPGLMMGLTSGGSGGTGNNNNTNNVCLKILPKAQFQPSGGANKNNNNLLMIRKPGTVSTTATTHTTTTQVNNQANHTNDHGEMDEASSGGTVGHNYRSQLSYRCGHCQQVSNWKHVIQRHCRLKHGGNINIEQIRSPRSATTGAGGSAAGTQKQTTDSNNLKTANISNTPSAMTATTTNENGVVGQPVQHFISSLQSPPLLAPLFQPGGGPSNHSKEMQAAQQKLSMLINSISSGIVGPAAEEATAEHMNRKKQYDCAHCSYVTDNKSQFSYHKSLHKPIMGEELKCNYCSYTTTKRALLTQHMRIHQSNPDDIIVVESENHSVFPRGVVDPDAVTEEEEERMVTGRENNKENHVVAAAAAKRRKTEFMCPYCPYSDANSELVNDHKQFHLAVSGERLKFTCEFCDFNAHSEKTMKDHRKLHFSFLEKGNATAVEFCTKYEKLKLFVAATATSGPSKNKKIYDEEEIEDENPWMHSANSSSSSGQAGGKALNKARGAKVSTEATAGGGGKAAINV